MDCCEWLDAIHLIHKYLLSIANNATTVLYNIISEGDQKSPRDECDPMKANLDDGHINYIDTHICHCGIALPLRDE